MTSSYELQFYTLVCLTAILALSVIGSTWWVVRTVKKYRR